VGRRTRRARRRGVVRVHRPHHLGRLVATTPDPKANPNSKILLLSLVTLIAFGVAAFAFLNRADNINQTVYDNCVTNEVQDAVIVAQLEAAKRRARASLPPKSAELLYQLDILQDGINALEPPDESPCEPPEGTLP
jgi:hypothetical protein